MVGTSELLDGIVIAEVFVGGGITEMSTDHEDDEKDDADYGTSTKPIVIVLLCALILLFGGGT